MIIINEDLKPCPFCGKKAKLHRATLTINNRLTDSVVAKCIKCNSRSRRYLFDGTTLNDMANAYKNCISAWNSRVNNE